MALAAAAAAASTAAADVALGSGRCVTWTEAAAAATAGVSPELLSAEVVAALLVAALSAAQGGMAGLVSRGVTPPTAPGESSAVAGPVASGAPADGTPVRVSVAATCDAEAGDGTRNLSGLHVTGDPATRFSCTRMTGVRTARSGRAGPGGGGLSAAGAATVFGGAAWDASPGEAQMESSGQLMCELLGGVGVVSGFTSSTSTKLKKFVIDADARICGCTAGWEGRGELYSVRGDASAHVAAPLTAAQTPWPTLASEWSNGSPPATGLMHAGLPRCARVRMGSGSACRGGGRGLDGELTPKLSGGRLRGVVTCDGRRRRCACHAGTALRHGRVPGRWKAWHRIALAGRGRA